MSVRNWIIKKTVSLIIKISGDIFMLPKNVTKLYSFYMWWDVREDVGYITKYGSYKSVWQLSHERGLFRMID